MGMAEVMLPGLRMGGLGETSIHGDVALCSNGRSQTHTWQMLPGGSHGIGRGDGIPYPKGAGGEEAACPYLCPPSRGTGIPVITPSTPTSCSTSRSYRKPWTWVWGLQAPSGKLPIEHPITTVQPPQPHVSISYLLMVVPPLPSVPPPRGCEVKVG